ncbi:glycosyltransferase family 4 protein [Telluribacter sp.]|uniref:glycosyltransferase family 4 protein n=1 Tax=Telluribacter sp. TaxID=1978767 RepID=UPI002E0FF908|nr:glycosyltransferase family 4 protein [Telluribacter sp.]
MDNKRVGIKESLKSKIVNAADAYFCFGTSSVEYLKSLGVPNEKITVRQAAVIDEKVILEAYQKGKSEKQAGQELPLYNFVYVGRLAPEKNLLLLLKAYQNVREVLPEAKNWGIIFVGDGTERKNLTDYAGQNKLAGVNFAGGFPWHKVPEWLAHSSVLVLPSLSEPWGLVVNEAMLCGLPVVVSNKCGCVEDLVQNGINGYSFHPASQQELEIILKLFINDPERIKPMGEASRKIISPFSSEKVAKEMVTTYHQLSVSK